MAISSNISAQTTSSLSLFAARTLAVSASLVKPGSPFMELYMTESRLHVAALNQNVFAHSYTL